jgi:anti-sigma B factor antagonist
MSFSIVTQGDRTIVGVSGQLVVANRQELKERVLDELQRGVRRFVIDFRDAGYIDSAGLGVLVALSKKIREQAGELRLAHLNDDLKTLFEVTKLDAIFRIVDEDDGLAGRQAPLRPKPPGPLEGRADWPDASPPV